MTVIHCNKITKNIYDLQINQMTEDDWRFIIRVAEESGALFVLLNLITQRDNWDSGDRLYTAHFHPHNHTCASEKLI